MNTTGPFYPTTSADGGFGSGGPWTSLGNVFASDDAYANGDISGGGYTSSYLIAKGYGFSIPSTATINGVLVEVERNGFQAQDSGVTLVKAGSLAGTGIVGSTGMSGTDAYSSFGGTSSLFGTTLTPADVNNSGFGAGYQAQNTHGGGNVAVDTIRITVYWTPYVPPQDINSPKHYIYKVYNNGVYQGNLPDPSNDFAPSQDINTAGSQISINIPASPDISVQPHGTVNIMSLGTGTSLIRNGNTVVVWEYSYYWPNGHIVFRGEMNRVEANFGGETPDDSITILVYHDGSDLDNQLLLAGVGTATADQSQLTQNARVALYDTTNDPRNGSTGFVKEGQTITIGAGVTNLGQMDLMLDGVANVTIDIYDSAALTTRLASVTKPVSVAGPTVVTFALSPHIIVTPAASYFFGVSVDPGQSIWIHYNTAGGYAGGQRYEAYAYPTGGGSYVAAAGQDLYFKTYSTTGSTTATFTSQDPTTGMLKPFMDDYISRGGLITYTAGSIDATGLSLTYGFNTNTILEGIKAMLSISPAGFYWYVDLGTNVLYFKKASTTADILITKGVHIEKLKIVASIENLKNTVYFVGGLVAGSNLYKTYQDSSSKALYGQKLDRKTDNRVTVTATADAIGTSALAQQKNEQFQTVVTVTDKTMDISSLRVGMVVGFRGFGTFVDTLLSQIVRIDYTPNEAMLTLGILPPQLASNVEQATRELVALQTITNPTSPS